MFVCHAMTWLCIFIRAKETEKRQKKKQNAKYSPLLVPSGPRRMVHSSIDPKAVNNCRTSSSVCCLLSIPTNSFLSAGGTDGALRNIEGTEKKTERTALVGFRVRGRVQAFCVRGVKREDLAANTENDKVTRLHQHPPS